MPVNDYKKCPNCECLSVEEYNDPIKYWTCEHCGAVYVLSKDGVVVDLLPNVKTLGAL